MIDGDLLLRGRGIYAEREPEDPFAGDGQDPDYFEALVFHLFAFARDGTFFYLREERSNAGESIHFEEGRYEIADATLVLRYERHVRSSAVRWADPPSEREVGEERYVERLALIEGPDGLEFDAPAVGYGVSGTTRFVAIERCPIQKLALVDLDQVVERCLAALRSRARARS